MATIRAVETVQVVWPERTAGSSAALPGQNLTPVYLGTNYWVEAVVLDDLSTWLTVTSGNLTCNGVRAAPDYSFGFWARTSNWSWSYAGSVVVPPGAVEIASGVVGVTAGTGSGSSSVTGYFDFGFPVIDTSGLAVDATIDPATLAARGFHNFGPLASFEGEGNTAYIYLSGIGTYAVTDPIYPTPARIAIPNIRRIIADYYPCALKSGDAWLSCNRGGGFMQYVSGADLKNNQFVPGNSKVYTVGGTVLPEIGAK